MKSLSKLLIFALAVLGANAIYAQASLKGDEAKKKTEVRELINSNRYTFEATKMVSESGNSDTIKVGTDLDISKDTLIVYLPGVNKEKDTSDKAIKAGITYTHFSYTKEKSKNGSWNITIIPEEKYAKGERDIKKINMVVSENGYATSIVSFTDRSPVTYYGYITGHNATFPASDRTATSDQ